MPNHVGQFDCTSNFAILEANLTSAPYSGPYAELWIEAHVAFNANAVAAVLATGSSAPDLIVPEFTGGDATIATYSLGPVEADAINRWCNFINGLFAGESADPAPAITDMQFYHLKFHLLAGSPVTLEAWIDGVAITPQNVHAKTATGLDLLDFYGLNGIADAGSFVYMDTIKVGTSEGGSDLINEDFEGGSISSGVWNSFINDVTIIDDPGIAPALGETPETVGRVGIAFDDPPLEPDPTWTWIDQLYENLVARYEIHSGKQTERDSTDTGTATVYLNDTQGLFDPLNSGSPYFGKLDGKQITLQLQNPVDGLWYPQFRGHINDYGYVLHPAINADMEPLVANIQVECVDIFDYLAGYQLQPGIDGDAPPVGAEGIVFYEDTAGTIDDRHIQVLTDVGIDSTRYVVFTGNVSGQETSYDPGDSALTALRDAADAELPTIANIYCDKQGRYVFHGRYSRFAPEAVEATTTTDIWDFNRWPVGDGAAIIADPTRAQIRVLNYSRPRSEVINSATAWPQHDPEDDDLIAGQTYEDATSISNYGKHSLSPMSDLIINEGTTTGNDKWVETAKYAELIVKNHKDPRNTITQINLKALRPDDPRAEATWDVLCKAQISDVMNVRVGYPAGVGIDDPDDPGAGEDYYIEGFTMRVSPLNPEHDMVDVDFDVSPAVWSMDTHGVFPDFS